MPTPIFLGASSILAHQSWLNTIGNNIANINTFGFKSGRMRFGDIIGATIGGVTIGNGVKVSGLDIDFSQGSLQATGQPLDLAINGKGFFVLTNNENRKIFTRSGAFTVNENKFLTDLTTGFRVSDTQGNPIKIDPNQFFVKGAVTTTVNLVGNLDPTTVVGQKFNTSTTVFDSDGRQHTLNLAFTKDAIANRWTVAVTSPETGVTFTDGAMDITYNANGTPPSTPTDAAINVNFGLGAQAITFNFADTSQTAGASNLKEGSKDGKVAIFFSNVIVSETGEVKAVKSDGSNETVTTIGIALFDNPGGLMQKGDGIYEASNNTGALRLVRALQEGSGSIRSGFLETSNVDMTTELVNLIVAQRGFSLGARVVQTADQVLQEAVNLKR